MLVKADVEKAAKGKKTQVAARNKVSSSDSCEDNTNPMSFQLVERIIDHMFGSSASYKFKQ